MNLDISRDLVIDKSVGLSENNRKSVSFDLEQKGEDVNSASTSFEGIEENVQKGHEQDSTNINETVTSTDPIVEDEFDSEDDIPLMQNVHRQRYVKSENQEGEDKEGVIKSDNNTEPDSK